MQIPDLPRHPLTRELRSCVVAALGHLDELFPPSKERAEAATALTQAVLWATLAALAEASYQVTVLPDGGAKVAELDRAVDYVFEPGQPEPAEDDPGARRAWQAWRDTVAE